MKNLYKYFSFSITGNMKPSILTLLSVALVGCGSQKYAKVYVETNPPGSKIELGNQLMGTSPMLIEVPVDGKGRLDIHGGRYWVITANPTTTTAIAPSQWQQQKFLRRDHVVPDKVYMDLHVQPDPRKKIIDINF